ncbi:MAG: (d)CMP kinase [Betaproteobacteria bacterium]|nr:(d)CMP kinase [Betaproteobacteria bacterium]
MTGPAVPVIAIDGPTASGKGTVAQRVADTLGWRYLDSGALYRLTALAALREAVPLDDESALARLAASLPITFAGSRIFLSGQEVTDEIRAEMVGEAASRIAALGALRAALLDRQRDFRQMPGLVADGRDMASVVFPDAALKVFLTASAKARAERRYKQLIEKGFSANLESLLRDLRARDARDAGRSHAPLVAAEGAAIIDSTSLSVQQTVQAVLDRWLATGYPA